MIGPNLTEEMPTFELCKETSIRDVKTLRQLLDENLQQMKASRNLMIGGRERSLAITKLQESIMWLGMELKELGAANPYPNSYDPSNTIVDPTADGLKL